MSCFVELPTPQARFKHDCSLAFESTSARAEPDTAQTSRVTLPDIYIYLCSRAKRPSLFINRVRHDHSPKLEPGVTWRSIHSFLFFLSNSHAYLLVSFVCSFVQSFLGSFSFVPTITYLCSFFLQILGYQHDEVHGVDPTFGL